MKIVAKLVLFTAFGGLGTCKLWKSRGGDSTQNQSAGAPQTETILGKKFIKGDTSCGGFPRLHIETEASTQSCVGLFLNYKELLGPDANPKSFFPRYMESIPRVGASGLEFLLTDWGNSGWEPGKGILWYIRITNSGGAKQIQKIKLLEGLNLPHTIRAGFNNRFFLGEMHQIVSFELSFEKEVPVLKDKQVVVSQLPPMVCGPQFGPGCDGKDKVKMSMHPLTHFTFYKQKELQGLIVNIGAVSDHCAISAGKPVCAEQETNETPKNSYAHGSSLRFYPLDAQGKTVNPNYTVIAEGLRNSMVLIQDPQSGDVIQAENARDFPDSRRPYEEMNLIRAQDIQDALSTRKAVHFGWPFCYDFMAQSEEWTADQFNCKTNPRYRPPAYLIPPHAAPLDAIYYQGTMFPGLKGKLLMSWHGYRTPGHRVVAYDVDPQTKQPKPTNDPISFRQDSPAETTQSVEVPFEPTGGFPSQGGKTKHTEVIRGWYDSLGFREKGAPVGLLEMSDGSILIAEDKNHAILRLAAFSGQPFPDAPKPPISQTIVDLFKANQTEVFSRLYPEVEKKLLHNNGQKNLCNGCHDSFVLDNDKNEDGFASLRYLVKMGTWVRGGDPASSSFWVKIESGSMPPKDSGISISPQDPIVTSVRQFLLEFPSVWVGVNEGGDNVRGKPQFGDAGKSNRCGLIKVNQLVATLPWTEEESTLAKQLSGQTLYHPTRNPAGKWLKVWIPENSPLLRKGQADFPCEKDTDAKPGEFYIHISAVQRAG